MSRVIVGWFVGGEKNTGMNKGQMRQGKKGKEYAGWGQSMALAFCSGRSKETCEGKARLGFAPLISKIDALKTQNARSEPRKDKSGWGRALSQRPPSTAIPTVRAQ
ncbi:unnamed protein product [Fusarium venenatum]|uniref:Uncharacterized protein n=1 Tax=Fusarium venenatum TaxID=56646 RepID=A0A2L2SNR4_9HYPO|nr:uncharacterized protein FVRRES_11947 [Fusarium venenatum]CEI39256.1 unnamed protein product [Fusarium venenatum]